jgi:hypothetical protein
MTNIIEKIQKVLALAKDNPNDGEKFAALELAAKMMLEYNITERDLEDIPRKDFKFTEAHSFDHIEEMAAKAAAVLFNCEVIQAVPDRLFSIVGRQTNLLAMEETYSFILNQIEELSKLFRKDNTFDKDFRYACSVRVYFKAVAMMEEQIQNHNNLPVVVSIRTEVKDFLQEEYNILYEPQELMKVTNPIASTLGFYAGETIKLRKEID